MLFSPCKTISPLIFKSFIKFKLGKLGSGGTAAGAGAFTPPVFRDGGANQLCRVSIIGKPIMEKTQHL